MAPDGRPRGLGIDRRSWSRSTAGCCSTRSTTTTRAPGPVTEREPARAGRRGGDAEVSEVRVYRDIYYTGTLANTPRRPTGCDRREAGPRRVLRPGRQQPGLERFAVLERRAGGARLDVRGKAVPGPSAGRGGARSRSSAGRFAGFPIPVEFVTFDRVRAVDGSGPAMRRASDRAAARRGRHDTMGRSSATLPAAAAARATAGRDPSPPPGGASRHGRGDRRGLYPGARRPGLRGPGVRDPHRVDGPDPDGPAQRGRLPAVRLRLRGERLGGSRAVDRRAAATSSSGHLRPIAASRPSVDEQPSFKGDRILVMMFPYDLPFLPGSGAARALGRRRLPLSRGARGQLHQAAGRPARRDDPDRHGDIYVKPPGGDDRSRSPASRCGTSRRCRSSSTTIAIAPGPGRSARMAALAAPDGGWTASRPAEQPLSRPRPPASEWAELRYQHLVPDPEQWDAILERPDRCRGRPAPTLDHRLLLVQHQPDRPTRPNSSDAADGRAPGCSPTGSAT